MMPMAESAPTISIFLGSVMVIALALAALLYRYWRLTGQLRRQLAEALANQQQAEQSLHLLQQQYSHNLEFQKNLSEAELTTRLQRSRLTTQHARDLSSTPERYGYIRSLADKGMGAAEIAAILSISSQEAEQLVKLSQLGKTG